MVASDSTKLSVSSLLNISMSVEKWLPTGYLLKVTTNCVVLWNQKSWCSTLSLYKNKIKGRIFQACSLKQKIKKRRFSVLGKMNFLGRAGEESSPTVSMNRKTKAQQLRQTVALRFSSSFSCFSRKKTIFNFLSFKIKAELRAKYSRLQVYSGDINKPK